MHARVLSCVHPVVKPGKRKTPAGKTPAVAAVGSFVEPRTNRGFANEAAPVLELGPGPGYFSAGVTRSVPEGCLLLIGLHEEMLQKARPAALKGRQPSPRICYTASRPVRLINSGGGAMTKNDYFECVMDAYRPAETLIRMVPADQLDWRPGPKFMSLGQLLCHIGEGLGNELRHVLTGQWPTPEEMAEGMKLENMPSCTAEEALNKLQKDKTTLREVLDSISEEDFAQKVVSVPWGWQAKMERMAISFREHFTNHKMQLFTYLKLLDLPVNTGTLYGA
jgi:hypothetical protein